MYKRTGSKGGRGDTVESDSPLPPPPPPPPPPLPLVQATSRGYSITQLNRSVGRRGSWTYSRTYITEVHRILGRNGICTCIQERRNMLHYYPYDAYIDAKEYQEERGILHSYTTIYS